MQSSWPVCEADSEGPTLPTRRGQKNWQLPAQGSLDLKPARTGLGVLSVPRN